MINLIDSTFKNSKRITLDQLIELIHNEPLKGINWWNSNDFPIYMKNIKKNPWDIFNTITGKLRGFSIVIDLKGDQLNKNKVFSDKIVNEFLTQLTNNKNISVKIYDPLNDITKIEKIIKIANKLDLKLIGGIFLRPDLNNFPKCHTDIIKMYNDFNMSYISLLEPLGLLRQQHILKITELINNYTQIDQINLSFKNLKFQQTSLINEAINCGITEFDFDLNTNEFGYPSLESIINSTVYLKKGFRDDKLPIGLLKKIKPMETSNFNLKHVNNEPIHDYLQFVDIPLNTFKIIKNLQYFTNIEHDLITIISEIKKIQHELGNPPLIDPFQTIIISQAIFRLQNSKKGIRTLDTLKYISGYWGNQPENLKGEFKDFSQISNDLKSKSKIFSSINESEEKINTLQGLVNDPITDSKSKLLFIISPEEANYYFNEYLPNPKTIDFSRKENLAKLVKTIYEQENNPKSDLQIKSPSPTQSNIGEFKWRYLSRLFQMGKF